MKHNNHHHRSARSSEPALVPIRFEFTHPNATTVCIAGSFNDWNPTAKPMHSSGKEKWLKETDLKPGIYEYCLVVDGRWISDPQAADQVPNPFGGQNSVLRVNPKT